MQRMIAVIAVLIGLMALSLFAQNSLLDQGRAAMSRNDDDAAAALFEKAVAQNPKSAEAHYWLGSAYGSQAEKASIFGQASLAGKTRDEFEKAVELDPNHLDARFGLIQYYVFAPGIMGGSYDKAFAQAAEIRKRDPLMGHRAAAFIYSNQKKTEGAKKEYLDEVKEFPNSARAHLDVGVFVYFVGQNYKAAADEYETALKLDPAYMPSCFRAGQVTVFYGDPARGEELLRKYLNYSPKENEPSLARAHYWLGRIFEKQGKKAEAKASYAASLKLSPKQKDVAEALKRVS
jgi:tetratricopeptide (TPR) repeat protein